MPATVPSNPAPLFDPARLERPGTALHREPFCFLVASGQLPLESRHALQQDFPRYTGAGFFPHDEKDCGASINRLVAELIDPLVASTVGAKLGIDNLGQYPTLVTLCRALNKRHGTIHTDSRSKIATALLYLNESWPTTSNGCLRFLANSNDINALVTPEIKPLYGNFVVFKRAANSFHGHLPFEGERLVIQVAWLTSENEKIRKTRRGRMSRFFKWLFGKFDRQYGADKARSDPM